MNHPVAGANLSQILVPDVSGPVALSCHEDGCLYLRTSLIRPRPADDIAPGTDPEFTFSAFSREALALPGLFDRVDKELGEAYKRSHDDEE
jgi:hypothetical protein